MTIPIRPEARECPPTPRDESRAELGFTRRRMVDWLAPGQLARTGIQALLGGVFGAYSDRREVQAALHHERDFEDYADRGELWIDFVADLGDGFDVTHTVARLLAAPTLRLATHGGAVHETRRGDLLVMGGDQVYPTPSHDAYRDRTKGPYRAALPCVPPGQAAPHLYAIPGNHDWYDGLTAFLREFCQESWLGGWKMRQRRSYFAARLPHGWWLWGIDVQLDAYVDRPQLDYFDAVRKSMQPGDKVILVVAHPAWVAGGLEGPEAFRTLAFFEDRIIRERGKGRLALALTGDLHHYARYESAEGPPSAPKTQRITAGGGGAYLFATHQLPESLDLVEQRDRPPRRYALKETYPSRGASRRLAFGCLRLPWRSPGFGVLVAAVYTLYAWLLQSASRWLGEDVLGQGVPSLMDKLKALPLAPRNVLPALAACGSVLANAPASVLLTLLVAGGLIAFCSARRRLAKLAVGLAHAAAHVALNLLLVWIFARLNSLVLPYPIRSWQHVTAFIGEMLVAGALLGSWLMAVYLLLCSLLGKFHTGEVFSSQHIAGYKNFLRLHLGPSGTLRVYPVAVPKPGKWRLDPQAAAGEPWFEPRGAPPACHLIEPPIDVG